MSGTFLNVASDGPERVNLRDEIHICAIRAYRDVFTASLRSIRYYRSTDSGVMRLLGFIAVVQLTNADNIAPL
ncbi:hypothetical protein MFFDBJGM_04183 [Pectobacterium versatile]|nr:hypothetical protein OA04_27250 [Pectobacterium versatile]GBO51146.1 hypothetical protein MFFDBJGM_04183 [Pectobacterium versatile]